ncbi:MAG: SDR family NAD(P)-dependent oxidoreductase [Bacteroidota bacterium]
MSKIALVTGANRGIGFAVAKGLLQKGITVIATSRNELNKEELMKQLSTYGAVKLRVSSKTRSPTWRLASSSAATQS